MPISATGFKPERDAGFTLVEALTTLLIIALMAGAIVLVIPGPDREARAFAERFAARLSLASEESIIANRTIALVMTPEGYGFARLEETGWRDMARGAPLSFRPWPETIEAHIEAAETRTEKDERAVRFNPEGGATPARILIARAGARWLVEVDGQGRTHVARAE